MADEEPGNVGLRNARIRAAYLFAGLIAFLVIYSEIARLPVDISVFGLLVGGLVTLLGIEVATSIARVVRDASRKD